MSVAIGHLRRRGYDGHRISTAAISLTVRSRASVIRAAAAETFAIGQSHEVSGRTDAERRGDRTYLAWEPRYKNINKNELPRVGGGITVGVRWDTLPERSPSVGAVGGVWADIRTFRPTPRSATFR